MGTELFSGDRSAAAVAARAGLVVKDRSICGRVVRFLCSSSPLEPANLLLCKFKALESEIRTILNIMELNKVERMVGVTRVTFGRRGLGAYLSLMGVRRGIGSGLMAVPRGPSDLRRINEVE